MDDYLPEIYVEFQERFADVAKAQGALARVIREQTPFDDRTDRLVKLALAVGAQSPGAVRSNVRKALDQGVTVEELRAPWPWRRSRPAAFRRPWQPFGGSRR
ncbi:carboxymuconolactone decarboxylase family protein [Pedococcus sp. 5OH_020]|uniref:carboxymuconolactone decarboxylase family protein n=1 Tax=Pedococcus sp. 5OH_020 TaxID=2989814 RepID=UPI0022EA027F|nr:hypothetical protein [Pedococcus sp. 5OH_020]